MFTHVIKKRNVSETKSESLGHVDKSNHIRYRYILKRNTRVSSSFFDSDPCNVHRVHLAVQEKV